MESLYEGSPNRFVSTDEVKKEMFKYNPKCDRCIIESIIESIPKRASFIEDRREAIHLGDFTYRFTMLRALNNPFLKRVFFKNYMDGRRGPRHPDNLTGSQVKEILGVSLEEVRKFIKNGELKAEQYARGHTIEPEDLKDFLERHPEFDSPKADRVRRWSPTPPSSITENEKTTVGANHREVASAITALHKDLSARLAVPALLFSKHLPIVATNGLAFIPLKPGVNPIPILGVLKPGITPIPISCKFLRIPLRPYHKAGTTVQGCREGDVLSAIRSNDNVMKNFSAGVSIRTIRSWINTGRILADKTEMGLDGIPVVSKTGNIFFIEAESLKTFLYVKYKIPKTSIVLINLNNKTP